MSTPESQTLPSKLADALDRELDESEELVWTAQPSPGVLQERAAISICLILLVAVPFTIAVMIAFLVERHADWVGLMALGQDPVSFVAYAIRHWGWLGPLLIPATISLAFVYLPFAAREARETIYAITPKRAIVLRVRRNGTRTERDYCGEELSHLSREEKPDGSGDLIFENARVSQRGTVKHAFYGIPDVIEVERLLRKLFADA